MGLGLGLGIWWPIQTSIIPGLLKLLEARADYFENKTCTTNTLDAIAAVRYTPPPPPPPPGLLLEDYPGAAAAYSLRNLIDTTTSVVRVRRSNDNTEQDFSATEITDGTLTTFTGANDGFVTTWYDQSGNGNNYTQNIANEQPKLVSFGVVELENGKPTILFDGVNDSFVMNNKPSTSRLDFYQVYNNTKGKMLLSNGNGSTYCEVAQISNSTQLYANYGSPTFRVNSAPQTWLTRTNVYNALSFSRLIQTTNNADIVGWLSYRFSKLIFGGFTFGGNVQELVYYDFDQELNNQGIETNINTEYTIY